MSALVEPAASRLPGYSALRSVTQRRSAISAEAAGVHLAALALVNSMEQSRALFGPKADAISQIWALVSECAEAGWDGDGAEPISEIAAHAASDFIRALPDDVPLPEFAPEPDGFISLDWIQSRSRLFSLSVGLGPLLAYAWLDGGDRGHAVARFDGETVPLRILDGIRRTVSRGDAAVGSL